jgi:hypothetical protein
MQNYFRRAFALLFYFIILCFDYIHTTHHTYFTIREIKISTHSGFVLTDFNKYISLQFNY